MVTSSQFRAASGLLGWSYEKLAEETGVARNTLANLAQGKHEPNKPTLEKIIGTFEKNGVEFIDGGVRWAAKIIQVIEGDDFYLKLLDDAFLTLRESKGEFLKFAADEKRSSTEVIEKLRAMRKVGIPTRSLIQEGNTHLMGPLEEYRWLDNEIYADGDVKIIYANKVAYLMSWLDTKRIILIQDEKIAEENRRVFNFLWKLSKTPTHTTAEEFYEDKK